MLELSSCVGITGSLYEVKNNGQGWVQDQNDIFMIRNKRAIDGTTNAIALDQLVGYPLEPERAWVFANHALYIGGGGVFDPTINKKCAEITGYNPERVL